MICDGFCRILIFFILQWNVFLIEMIRLNTSQLSSCFLRDKIHKFNVSKEEFPVFRLWIFKFSFVLSMAQQHLRSNIHKIQTRQPKYTHTEFKCCFLTCAFDFLPKFLWVFFYFLSLLQKKYTYFCCRTQK